MVIGVSGEPKQLSGRALSIRLKFDFLFFLFCSLSLYSLSFLFSPSFTLSFLVLPIHITSVVSASRVGPGRALTFPFSFSWFPSEVREMERGKMGATYSRGGVSLLLAQVLLYNQEIVAHMDKAGHNVIFKPTHSAAFR